MGFKSLGDALNKHSFSETNKTHGKEFLLLIRHWHKVIGEKLSQNTRPVKLRNQTLIVLTRHSTLSQHLHLMERSVISKIYQEFPSLKDQINKIYFRVNQEFFEASEPSLDEVEITSKPQREKLHPYSPKYIELKKQAIDFYGELDPDYSEGLISLFIQLKMD